MIEAIKWEDPELSLLDQRALPEEISFVKSSDFRDIIAAIRDMVVRGAPAIGIAGAYAMAMAARECSCRDFSSGSREGNYRQFLKDASDQISNARPTAVNLGWAVNRVLKKTLAVLGDVSFETGEKPKPEILSSAAQAAIDEAKRIHLEDVDINRLIAANGEKVVPLSARILTHCNAGALATGGYGTALGVIRKAFEKGKVSMVYADETRPFLQGARLTAWELLQDNIPVTLLVDSAAGYLMSLGKVDLIIVGADRVTLNGDVANKIGTFSLALLAKYHKIPFYVASPVSTFDPHLETGKEIAVEERAQAEVVMFRGTRVAPAGVQAFNPAFDITPSHLIEGIITEKGVIAPPYRENIEKLLGRR